MNTNTPPGRGQSDRQHRRLDRITAADILAWRPCSGWRSASRIRATYRRANKTGDQATPIEVVRCRKISHEDRLWLVLRLEIFSGRELRLFACWCARVALNAERLAGREPLAASWQALHTGERFAEGRATQGEATDAFHAGAAASASLGLESAARFASDAAAETVAFNVVQVAFAAAFWHACSAAVAAGEQVRGQSAAEVAARDEQLDELARMLAVDAAA